MRGERSGVWDCFLDDISGAIEDRSGEGSSREEDMGRCTLI